MKYGQTPINDEWAHCYQLFTPYNDTKQQLEF